MLPQEILDDVANASCNVIVAHVINSTHALKKINDKLSNDDLDIQYRSILIDPQHVDTLEWLIVNNVDLAPFITTSVLSAILKINDKKVMQVLETAPHRFFWCLAGYNEKLCFLIQISNIPWIFDRLAKQTHNLILKGWDRSISMRSLMGIRILAQMPNFDRNLYSITPWGLDICPNCFCHIECESEGVSFHLCHACRLGDAIKQHIGDEFVQRFSQSPWSQHTSIWTERLFDQTFARFFGLNRNHQIPMETIRGELLENSSSVCFFANSRYEFLVAAVKDSVSIAKKFEDLNGPILTTIVKTTDYDTDAIHINIGEQIRLFEFNPKCDFIIVRVEHTTGSNFYEWMISSSDWFAVDYTQRLDSYKLTSFPCFDNIEDSSIDARLETWLPVNSNAFSIWMRYNNCRPLYSPRWGDSDSEYEEISHINPVTNRWSWDPPHVLR
jgi:hypothetical protein